MYKHVDYIPEGVCSSRIEFDLVDGYVHHVHFTGGCGGNTKGVAALCEGRKAEELTGLLKGIICHDNNSCPNQLAIAIEKAIQETD